MSLSSWLEDKYKAVDLARKQKVAKLFADHPEEEIIMENIMRNEKNKNFLMGIILGAITGAYVTAVAISLWILVVIL